MTSPADTDTGPDAQDAPSAAEISGVLVALLSLDDGPARFERLLYAAGCPADLQPAWHALARDVRALVDEYGITATMARTLFFEIAPEQARAFFAD